MNITISCADCGQQIQAASSNGKVLNHTCPEPSTYGENYAHAIHIATRIALGHGLTLPDVRTITADSLHGFENPGDIVENVDPIGPDHVVDEGLQGLAEQFQATIMEAERYGLDHDQILTEFLLTLSLRPPIFPDH